MSTLDISEVERSAILIVINEYFNEHGFVPTPVRVIEIYKTYFSNAKAVIAEWRVENPDAITKTEALGIKHELAVAAAKLSMAEGYDDIGTLATESFAKCWQDGHDAGYKEAYSAAYDDALAAFLLAGNNEDEDGLAEYMEKQELDTRNDKLLLEVDMLKLKLATTNNELAREKLLNNKLKQVVSAKKS